MNFKLFKLRTKIFYYSIFGKIQKQIPQLDLESQGHDAKRILLMFPFDEPSFRVATFSFRGLGNEEKSKNYYTFLIKDTFKPFFNIRRGETIILISDPKNPS